MTDSKKKRLYWAFKIASVLVAVGLPLYAICDHFPVWVESPGRASVTSVLLIGFTLIVVFRRSVFMFIRDKLNLKYAPPIAIWPVLIVCSYALEYISNLISDMNTVFWYGFIGAALGMLFTFISNKFEIK